MRFEERNNLKVTKNGNFRDVVKKKTYYLRVCKNCDEKFLGEKNSKFCCKSCANSGKNHPMYGKTGKKSPNYGRHHTEETKKRMSYVQKGENSYMFGRRHAEETKKRISDALSGEKHPNYGKHPSEETRKKMSGAHKGEKNHNYGKHRSEETKKKISKKTKGRTGKKGCNSKNLPAYDTYAYQLEWCEDEEVRRNKEDPNVLEVKCVKCHKWYVPSLNSVNNRVQYLKGNYDYECRFYCSEPCKHACPIYRKSAESLMIQDAVRSGRMEWLEMDREMQPELRKMVLERDKYTCQKCGLVDKSGDNLRCHHVLPASIEPLESADVDNCITFCVNCHHKAHEKDGCRYGQLRIEEDC